MRIGSALFGGAFSLLMFLALLALYVYLIVLFIKLAHRGIKALDIYINKNSYNGYSNQQSYHNPSPNNLNNQ